MQRAALDARRRPLVLGCPRAGVIGKIERLRPLLAGDPDAVERLIHDAGVLAGEPMPPPAQRFLQIADQRSGRATAGIGMRPRSDNAELRPRQMFEQARHEVRIAVFPAADGHDGAFDRRKILADRALPPVVVTALMREPHLRQRAGRRQPVQPHGAPGVADDLRIGRHRLLHQHEVRPHLLLGEQRAAHVVNVVGITVVGGAVGDDRFQRRGPARRDLQRVEAAPGNAGHADIAVAPGLASEMADNLAGIFLLERQVLVGEIAAGIAAAPDIYAGAGNAVPG